MSENSEERRRERRSATLTRLINASSGDAGLKQLSGFLIVESRREGGYWRIYRNAELSKWWEVAKEDIVGFCAPKGVKFGFGPSAIWVARNAKVFFEDSEDEEDWVNFLKEHAIASTDCCYQACCCICVGDIHHPEDDSITESYPGPC